MERPLQNFYMTQVLPAFPAMVPMDGRAVIRLSERTKEVTMVATTRILDVGNYKERKASRMSSTRIVTVAALEIMNIL